VAELTKKCGAQQSNKTHFYCKKLTFYEQLIKFVEQVPPVPALFHHWTYGYSETSYGHPRDQQYVDLLMADLGKKLGEQVL